MPSSWRDRGRRDNTGRSFEGHQTMLINPKGRATARLDVPDEPGQWIEIQRLAWSELPGRMDAERVQRLFEKALIAWSYPDDLKANIAFLDDTTAGWLLGEIDTFNHPKRSEAAQGNAPAPSAPSSTET